MKTLLIAYDLNAPGQNYAGLIQTLQGFAEWCRPLESTWVIKSSQQPTAIRDLLLTKVDRTDEILVVDITGDDWASWLSERVNNWLAGGIAA